ncbi:MAG: efflux RND transporter periplasmic adaptor subunit [Candidatus Thiodiazotropha sp. (ex Epidulcina cf. delphinae)]|nr:efflux RND transporter periplasmic adaptor subunit [Candidatus Thiodiazotropha sp. (ex Epidulcina cf. delphinae)]
MRKIRRDSLPMATGSALLCLVIGCSPGSNTDHAGRQQKPSSKVHPVAVETVEPKTSALKHERNGTLKARRTVRIFNQEEGRITALPYFEGDRIERGELIARLEDELLKAELEKTIATTRQMRINLKRQQGLAKRKAVSEDELVRARTDLSVAEAEQRVLRARLGYTRITAPFTGLVSRRLVEPGDVVPRHTHLMTMIDPDSLVTRILVSDLLLPQLKLGDPVTARIDGLGERRFPGRIVRIHPELDERTRMGLIEVALDPVPAGARSGQLCRVTLKTADLSRISIPFNALRRDNSGEYVYRLDSERQAQRISVNSGLRIADRIEILRGLAQGDRIITKGFLELQEGMTVEPVN